MHAGVRVSPRSGDSSLHRSLDIDRCRLRQVPDAAMFAKAEETLDELAQG
jgi:hypothetical protein